MPNVRRKPMHGTLLPPRLLATSLLTGVADKHIGDKNIQHKIELMDKAARVIVTQGQVTLFDSVP